MKQQVTVPNNYTLCLKSECPKASACLRYAATKMMPSEVQRWSIVSPKYLARMEGECPLYRSAEKVRYARGFARMMSALTVKQAHTFKDGIVSTFGMNMYYRMRRGERLITPCRAEGDIRPLGETGHSGASRV